MADELRSLTAYFDWETLGERSASESVEGGDFDRGIQP